jgi:pimeloyl-ACP methyl ester carboxylesterase
MRRTYRLGAILCCVLLAGNGTAKSPDYHLAGQLVDHTHNHGADNRIWSAALQERRDLYIYLPPGFDPCRRYPLLLWLHGINQDEKAFVEFILPFFDEAMACGKLAPTIIAIPDGSTNGRSSVFGSDPLFLNSRLGAFEDHLMKDVWAFVLHNYPVRPEREAHVLAGFSAGGGAAFRLAIKYRDRVGVVFGIHPPLNLRWVDCHGHYFANFDPDCWGWRTDIRGREPIGRFYGVIKIRLRAIVDPLFGRGPEAVEDISRENPIELIDTFGLREGELAMYVAYAGRDQFNLDAQVESFLYRARERGLTVQVGYEPRGRHDRRTAKKLIPGILDWLAPLLAPFH